MSADAGDNVVAKQDPNPNIRLQIGWCEYKHCGRPAYYTIDLGCDDMQVDVCSRDHTKVWKLFDIKCESTE